MSENNKAKQWMRDHLRLWFPSNEKNNKQEDKLSISERIKKNTGIGIKIKFKF